MSEYPALHMIIDGEKVSGGGRRTFDVVNPVTGEPIGALPLAEAGDLDRALEVAAKGLQDLAQVDPAGTRRGAPGRRPPDGRAPGTARPRGDDGAGQAARREPHRSDDERRPFQLLRRRVLPRVRPRAGPPGGPALDRALRAGRPGRRFRAVELPARQPGPQARRADRRGLLGDHESGRGDAGLGARRAAVPARRGPAQGSRAGGVRRARRSEPPPARQPR